MTSGGSARADRAPLLRLVAEYFAAACAFWWGFVMFRIALILMVSPALISATDVIVALAMGAVFAAPFAVLVAVFAWRRNAPPRRPKTVALQAGLMFVLGIVTTLALAIAFPRH